MRIAIVAAVIAALTSILLKSGVIDALLMFVIVGAIPSTSLSLSPSVMFILVMIVGWLGLVQVALAAIRVIDKHRPSNFLTYRLKKTPIRLRQTV